jgi:hypothetical protein
MVLRMIVRCNCAFGFILKIELTFLTTIVFHKRRKKLRMNKNFDEV